MEFLKNNRLFEFKYDGKNVRDCEFKKETEESANTLITRYYFKDGLKVTNIAKNMTILVLMNG